MMEVKHVYNFEAENWRGLSHGKVIVSFDYRHKIDLSGPNCSEIPSELTQEELLMSYRDSDTKAYLYKYHNGMIMAGLNLESKFLKVFGYFHTLDEAETEFKYIKSIFKPAVIEDTKISMDFWSQTSSGYASNTSKTLYVPTFSDIKDNYEPSIQAKVQELIDITSKELEERGKLVLWRGPAGAGKTYLIRALCKAWKKWCNFHYIIDSDVFFTRADYMVQTIGGISDSLDDDLEIGYKASEKKWNLLILEDCGELIAIDAKATGQSLSKLLNLSDGLLGQGLNLVILITTNEDINKLDPAIRRQGRCLSNLEFGPLSKSYAMEWLKNKGYNGDKVPSEHTLADLYAFLTEHQTITNVAPQRTTMGFK